jgi:GntR family transcriptional regulator
MEPQPTAVLAPIQLRIADDLRMKIERGELRPGDKLPSAHELAQQWSCSPSSGRAAINLLKKQGLATGEQGQRPVVRIPPRQAILRQDTNQLEKDRVLLPEEERRQRGAAEDNLDVSIDDLNFTSRYVRMPAPDDLAEAFGVEPGTELLRREYETTCKTTGVLEQQSVSYLLVPLIEANPDLFDASKEPWPGGMQHQLYTVGIEIARMDTEVTAIMPTTVEIQRWDMPEGVPLLYGRQYSIDTQDRVVEISEARYPADRTKMLFSMTLTPWKKP